MRRHRLYLIAIGVTLAWASSASVGRAGWLTLTAGLGGLSDPTAASEFSFGLPGGSAVVAVNQVVGGETVQAATGGGTTFFGGLATPVLLTLADGSAYLAGGNPPAGATGRGPNGGPAGAPSSVAPQAGGMVPPNAALLGLTFAELGADGGRALTVSVTAPDGSVLGTGTLAIPAGGWWVLGLGPDQQTDPDPDPGPIGPPPGSGGDPTPEPIPEPVPGPGPPISTPGVPEPATVTLAAAAVLASGLTALPPWLRRKRRAAGA
jgi:hypothetical protein